VSSPLPLIAEELCQGCGDCLDACPGEALELAGGVARLARPSDCAYCGDCELICPQGAIQLPLEIVARPEDD
jgi:NAD-dependent dihydropyrimidine dehydrogenase PreA subunit